MPIPLVVTGFNRDVLNPLMRRAVGIGPLAEIEHVGRRTGVVRRTPLLAFRRGDTVTVALTYGPDVDWLKNIRAAGRSRLRLGGAVLTLGAPVHLSSEVGLPRMPLAIRGTLRLLRVVDFVELPVVTPERTHRFT